MDSLLCVLHTKVIGNVNLLHILSVALGALSPFILGIILPRKRTVQYGRLLNGFLGLIMFQKRCFGKICMPETLIETLIHTVQTTFQDVSFGIYIDSRADMTKEEKQKKIYEYLNTTN